MLEDWVKERVKRLEDRFAIQDLVAAYCSAIDSRDLVRFVSLFTDDAIMRHRDGVMPVMGDADLEVLTLQVTGDDAGQGHLVVDDQCPIPGRVTAGNPLHASHRAPVPADHGPAQSQHGPS